MTTMNAHIATAPGSKNQDVVEVYFDNLTTSTAVAAATIAKAGIVKQGAAVAAVVSADSKAAAGANPTKAEFDAVVTEANECKKQLNALVASLKAAGALA